MKLILFEDGSKYIVESVTDFNCSHGTIPKQILESSDDVRYTTQKDVNCIVTKPAFIDTFEKIKRPAQTVTPKDAAMILAETMIGKDAVVVDAGGGSGGLSGFLSQYVKHIHTFEIREDHVKAIQKNMEMLNITNVTVKQHNVYESVPLEDSSADLVFYDLPEPWQNYSEVERVLKLGGWFIAYVPCTNQLHEVVTKLPKSLLYLKSIEVQLREWKVTSRAIRPQTQGAIHTGFLTFCRKI